MKKILGLDLGTTSIGWALINVDENNNPIDIQNMGVRIVPLSENEGDKFTKGLDITINADRTRARGARRNYDRYQLRRQALTDKMRQLDMLPDEHLIKLPMMELWQLRANAVTKKISLNELGRILYHLNQKRGYEHSRTDANDSKQREYVKEINNRYAQLQKSKMTIGQFFAKKLVETAIVQDGKISYNFRIKDQIYPRSAYKEEYDAIMKCQQRFYPNILTDSIIDEIRNRIIYYQRELRSCKHLVSVCEFEKRCFYDADGKVKRNKKDKIVYDGPKVAPRTSPLFQVFKDWQSINNLRFHNRRNEYLYITREQKEQIAAYMDNHEILKLKDVQSLLDITSKSGWYCDKAIKAGIKGNSTRCAILSSLSSLTHSKIAEITRFNLETEPTNIVDEETGEMLVRIRNTYQNEPLYRLWHIIYSIKNDNERVNAISKFLKEFEVEDKTIINSLKNIDFVTPGYANLSAKAICKILPYMMEGLDYSDSCEYAGYNHSNSLTKEENEKRQLLDKIPALKKNELRQPTVEKILNQTINVFNQINEDLSKDGERISEVRVELARELKQSKEERNEAEIGIRKQQKLNDEYAKILKEEGVRPTRNRILKYRLWRESNKSCFYCEQPISFHEFLDFSETEREHIIPKKLMYDDSFANQVCSCRKCNKEKGGRTAMDYMRTKPNLQFYLDKVDKMFQDHKISGKKHSHLLASYDDYLIRKENGKETKDDILIWEKPIERQLRLSQYISRKAQELLRMACRDVTATTGEITALIRHTWGYDTILHDLNFSSYKKVGLTELVKDEDSGRTREIIKDWSKRLDHRHHAIDALAVACTSRSIVQRINTLNASREEIRGEIKAPRKDWKDSNLLQQWIKEKMPFDRQYVLHKVASILISMKAGKKATVPGKRKIYKKGKPIVIQTGLRIPRGQLHEQTVYGAITQYEKGQKMLKIVTRYKMGVGSMGYVFNGKETCDVIKKNEHYEIVDGIQKALDYIVDGHIREVVKARINEAFPEGETYLTEAEEALAEGRTYDGKARCQKALDQLRTLSEKPLYADKGKHITIKSVRCFTGLNAVQPLRRNDDGEPISYVLTKNNHHVAIYVDEKGEPKECIYTFWQVVERSKYKLPLIIKNPKTLWEEILQREKDGEKFPDSLIQSLPPSNWTFIESLQLNDMFIMDMDNDDYNRNIDTNNYEELSKKLYRIQNISSGDYFLRLHTDTTTDRNNAKLTKKFLRKSLTGFLSSNPHKVQISLLGKIIRNSNDQKDPMF